MPVDKAFEEWLSNSLFSDDEIKFGDKFTVKHTRGQAMAFHGGFTSGQKSLSPEVREVLESIIGNEAHNGFSYCVFCENWGNHDINCTVIKVMKILEEYK